MTDILQEYFLIPQLLAMVLVILGIHLLLLSPCILFMSYVDRKLGADLQARIGPNQTPLKGLLQPLADTLKLLQKSKGMTRGDGQGFWLLYLILVSFALVTILPLSPGLILLPTELAPFIIIFAIFSIALGVLLLGVSGDEIERKLAALRFSAQSMVGVFPVLIATLTVGLEAGGLDWNSLVSHSQYWNPFHYVAFFVFFIGGLIALGLPPFEATAKQATYSGVWLNIWTFNRYYLLLLWSIVTTSLFLGGWLLPETLVTFMQELDWDLGLILLQICIVLIKSWILILIVIWVSRVNPRVRVDHVTELCWKFLGPLSLLALLGTLFFMHNNGWPR